MISPKYPISPRVVSACFAIALLLSQTSCVSFTQTTPSVPFTPPPSPKNKQPAMEVDTISPSGKFEKEINAKLLERDFESIEVLAKEARDKKERLPGAYWKLDSVYKGLVSHFAEYKGQSVTDEMWKNRLELLEGWKQNSPDSITARVALAEGHMQYAWFARGHGYADSVSRKDFQLFEERVRMAEKELLDAESLNPQCPRWYRNLLYVGMISGWPNEEFEQIYEKAIRFEPNYLQFHLIKSESVTPKWNGEQGDWQKFLDSLPGKLATLQTAESDIVYLVVAVNKLGDRSVNVNWAMIAKERISKGFHAMEKKYGIDNLRLNQFAFISCLTMDLKSAQAAFERIGSDRNSEVWSAQTFESMKELAKRGIGIAETTGGR